MTLIDNKPCLNNGLCNQTGAGLYACSCPPGYAGTSCQSKIDFCTSNPCLNGGLCIQGTTGYQCLCFAGWDSQFQIQIK